jgi:hypothetical protein
LQRLRRLVPKPASANPLPNSSNPGPFASSEKPVKSKLLPVALHLDNLFRNTNLTCALTEGKLRTQRNGHLDPASNKLKRLKPLAA